LDRIVTSWQQIDGFARMPIDICARIERYLLSGRHFGYVLAPKLNLHVGDPGARLYVPVSGIDDVHAPVDRFLAKARVE
jgi:hypothetical protein